jgi:hypothetical protein
MEFGDEFLIKKNVKNITKDRRIKRNENFKNKFEFNSYKKYPKNGIRKGMLKIVGTIAIIFSSEIV